MFFFLTGVTFCHRVSYFVFLMYYVVVVWLSVPVPVQLSTWKDSSPKCPVVSSGTLNSSTCFTTIMLNTNSQFLMLSIIQIQTVLYDI